jgi:saccharopine dehydrogenase-like NADP-dependent oxidoreductase
MRVLALGGYGTFGRYVAKNLCASDLVTEVVIAGRNLDAAKKFANELGSKARAVKVDALSEAEIREAAQSSDLLVNTAGPDYLVSYPAARAAIQVGSDYCDLCADVNATERLLKLDHDAKAQDVTILLGMGAAPGQTNLMMKHASSQLDNVEDVRLLLTYNLVGMISHLSAEGPAKAASEMRRTGKVNASWETVMNWGGGRVLVYEKGKVVDVNPLNRLERIELPDEGNAVFFPIGSPEAITIPHFLRNIDSASYMMRVSPPQISDLYLSLADRIRRKEISTGEAAILFHEGVAANQNEETAPSSWTEPKTNIIAVATGRKDSKRVRYSCRLASGWVGASFALSVAALRILRGKVKERGVLAPEACFDPIPFLDELAATVHVRTKEKRLFEEKFERLE